ncbi:hypothetical protein H2200_007035 [Cladophialophora chaetospira]|uniref:Serine/threonine-protein kinase ppk6 n=1 Tax=Cladophialophora chaetospira TaxID=386627 RepID=A0AA38X726_9EURO|nr:hypothetical protein H2200_007035 [Cladophialophora chaetospira]
MSADLFAAFIDTHGENPKQVHGPATQPRGAPIPDLFDAQRQTPAQSVQRQIEEKDHSSPLWKRNDDGGDILFDADEAGFGDDFGDFAVADRASGDPFGVHNNEGAARLVDVNAKERPDPRSTSFDFLSSPDDEALRLAQPVTNEFQVHGMYSPRPVTRAEGESSETAGDDEWGDFEQTANPEPPSLDRTILGQSLRPQRKAEDSVVDAPDEDWEPFDGDVTVPGAAQPAPSLATRSSQRVIPPATRKEANTPSVFERPTNVPPPSSLLQLLSTVFQVLHKSNAVVLSSKQDLTSQVTIAFRTASRIVAGRALRWKRDTILAQSVKLGQAGKSGGMKLASVNRSEIIKEERDAEDLIQDWSNYVHEFNSIVAQAGSPQRMKLSSKTSLRLVKATGNSDSSKQCALCGLKRTERLGDVDTDIDDLFGEFWVEHWGHKDCYDFWYTYKTLLRQR